MSDCASRGHAYSNGICVRCGRTEESIASDVLYEIRDQLTETASREYRKRQIELSLLRAQWWLASATSGHYKRRKLFHGATGAFAETEFTDDEKLADAMKTAMRHIELAAEFSEKLFEDEES